MSLASGWRWTRRRVREAGGERGFIIAVELAIVLGLLVTLIPVGTLFVRTTRDYLEHRQEQMQRADEKRLEAETLYLQVLDERIAELRALLSQGPPPPPEPAP